MRDTLVVFLDVEISLISSGTKRLPHEVMVSTKQTATASGKKLCSSSKSFFYFARQIQAFLEHFQTKVLTDLGLDLKRPQET
jgi:hypothetical protein